jgi:5-methylcytosine-specific restriction endonuclease McrA
VSRTGNARGRRAMPKRWRYEVAERDGAVCALCSRPLDVERATLDHIVPRSMGGPDHPDNLQLTHYHCNVKRGDGGGPTRESRMALRDGSVNSAGNRGTGSSPAGQKQGDS